MTVVNEEATANYVPAAAVIRRCNGEISFEEGQVFDILAFSKNAHVSHLPDYDTDCIVLGSGSKTYQDLSEIGEEPGD